MLVMIAEWDRAERTWWKRRNAQPSTTKFGQAECLKLLYPRPPRSTENAGEFSVIANVLPLSSRDIAPFVSCVADMQHKNVSSHVPDTV
jgi:hypothetical protein